MTTAQFVSTMKEKAAEAASHSARCRKEWRAMAFCAFILSGVAVVCALMHYPWQLRSFFVLVAIGFGFAGRSNLRTGESFSRQYLELREDALRYAAEAEDGKLS